MSALQRHSAWRGAVDADLDLREVPDIADLNILIAAYPLTTTVVPGGGSIGNRR